MPNLLRSRSLPGTAAAGAGAFFRDDAEIASKRRWSRQSKAGDARFRLGIENKQHTEGLACCAKRGGKDADRGEENSGSGHGSPERAAKKSVTFRKTGGASAFSEQALTVHLGFRRGRVSSQKVGFLAGREPKPHNARPRDEFAQRLFILIGKH